MGALARVAVVGRPALGRFGRSQQACVASAAYSPVQTPNAVVSVPSVIPSSSTTWLITAWTLDLRPTPGPTQTNACRALWDASEVGIESGLVDEPGTLVRRDTPGDLVRDVDDL